MRYEWDEEKNLANGWKHEVSFEQAALVFEDENCLILPDRIDSETGEQRWHAIGTARGLHPACCCWLCTCIGRKSMANKSSVLSRPEKLKRMTSEDIRNRQWSEQEKAAFRRMAERQAAGGDSDIDFSDIPPLTEEQLARMVRLRDVFPKVPVSVRLEPRVLAWLKSKGPGHLTRINDILVNLMEAEKRARPAK